MFSKLVIAHLNQGVVIPNMHCIKVRRYVERIQRTKTYKTRADSTFANQAAMTLALLLEVLQHPKL
jgi:hypothetical protein